MKQQLKFCGMVLVVVAAARGACAGDSASQPIQLPVGGELAEVEFDRHVASLLGRLGCNSAACHGSFQGKGGLRLSLFGQSPEMDFAALRGADDHPRIDRQNPAESLVLVKATGGEGHGGGVRFKSDSWEFEVFRRWIANGAERNAQRGRVSRLVLEPAEIPPLESGAMCHLHVWAEFQDGTKEEVTSFAELRVRDDTIATIDPVGQIQAQSSGTTAVIVSFRGVFASAMVTIPYRRDAAAMPAAATEGQSQNFIDEEISRQLASLNLDTSSPIGDGEFLRRVTLDVIGLLPTLAEIDEFLNDDDPHKRAKKIEALLKHPRRGTAWATRLCETTACNVEHLGSDADLRARRAKMWHDWFRKRINDNTSYDQIVHGVLCAVSRKEEPIEQWIDREILHDKKTKEGFDTDYADRPDLDLFWRRIGPQGALPVEDLAELTASAFLGLRLHCARCHQHPYDRWSQSDFAGYANIFNRVVYGSSTELRTAVAARLEDRRAARQSGHQIAEMPRVQEVFLSPIPRELVDAQIANTAPPQAPGGPVLNSATDSREELFRWLTQPDNPYFAPNIVNRVWSRYFGAGLVEPVDAFSAANLASHPRLLQRLSAEFVRSGYDLRALERMILNSQTYQRSSRPTGNNRNDQQQLSHTRVRPLSAEVLIDSLNQALETKDDFGKDAPEGSQALELAVNRFGDPAVQTLFRVLGRNQRASLCECDTPAVSSVRRSLFMMSDPRIVGKIAQGRLARLLADGRSDGEIIDEFYLAVLSRRPDADERDFCLKQIGVGEMRNAGLADFVWALINSREFSTNH